MQRALFTRPDRGGDLLPDVSLGAAGPFELILHQIGVVRGGDEVVTEGPAHVLIHLLVLCIEDHSFWMVQVHEEAIFGQQLLLLGCGDTEMALSRLDLIRLYRNDQRSTDHFRPAQSS